MGDAGSFTLGFLLAAISILGEWSTSRYVSCTVPVIILAVSDFRSCLCGPLSPCNGSHPQFSGGFIALCERSLGSSAGGFRRFTPTSGSNHLCHCYVPCIGCHYFANQRRGAVFQPACHSNPDDSGNRGIVDATEPENQPTQSPVGK